MMTRWCFIVFLGFTLLFTEGIASVVKTTSKPMETAETTIDIPPGADGFIVTLEVFSGVPDPQWMILRNNSKYMDIKKGLHRGRSYGPENAPGKLGFEGFLVQEVKNGKKQPEVLIVGRGTVKLQLLLLKSIPKGMISEKIYSIVQKEIQGGKVSAVFESQAKKRFAPAYNPWYWNVENHIERNNCYNFASTIRTDTFAQPGRRGGRPLPSLFNANDVKLSAMADRLQFETARPQMNAPDGPEHLVALVHYEGDPNSPYDRDYHWYRLDNNGYWSHKPGRTHATDRDGNGDRIRDPRRAANGAIPYRFVCFMTINRHTATII
ncbi:hypothetical protein ACROYT_G001176 [Oculina patagonica]